MHFKELKLYGFKSFAEETKLRFEPGVTAIVGPNGCGKSNLADAIKWVLGEQSAKELRGTMMEDIIFNGTGTTEPKGMAEVSLTFMNEANILPIDYDEVTLTRKVYRSGESEYFINKSRVRLKDIQDLLRGTGIGTSAYSIMEQGKIDLVLSSKPQDRRHVFEEASGITKYKAKKKETLNKLERTQENLQRVNDIIQEVERQLKSIERKVKKAQRYKKRFEHLEKLEMTFSKIEYEKIKSQVEGFTSDSKDNTDGLSKLESDINNVKAKLNQVKSESNRLTDELEALSDKLMDINNLASESESKLNLSTERIKDLNDKIQNFTLEEKEINDRVADVEKQIANFSLDIETLQKEEQDITNALAASEERLLSMQDEASEAQKVIKDTKVQLVDEISEETNLKNEIVRVTSDLRNFNNRLTRLNNEKQSLEGEKDSLTQKIKDVESQASKIDQDLEVKQAKVKATEEKLLLLQDEFKTTEQEINQSKSKYSQKKSKYDLFRQIKDKYEGFSSGVRTLIKLREEKSLDFEILAELVDVKKDYALSAEVALEENVQAIVVSDRRQADKIVNALDESESGKCKIIILDEYCFNTSIFAKKPIRRSFFGLFRNSRENDKGLSESLLDHVKSKEKKYEALFRTLLTGIYVVKDRNTALENSRQRDVDKFFVTLGGELFQKGKFLIGKSKHDEGFRLIGRESTIEDLSNDLSVLKKTVEDEELKIKDIESRISTKELEFKTASEELQTLQEEKRNKENTISNFRTDFKKIEDEYLVIDTELKEVTEELSTLRDEKKTIEQRKEGISSDVEHKHKLISDHQNNVSNLNQEKEELIVKEGKLKSELSSITERKQSFKEKGAMLQSLLDEQHKKMDYVSSGKNESRQRITQLEDEIKRYHNNVGDFGNKKEEIISKINKLKEERRAYLESQHDLEEEFNKQQEVVQSQMQRLQQIRIDRTQLEYKLQQLEDRIQDKYKKDLKEFVVPDEDLNKNVDKLKNDIDSLADKIEAMGQVSLMAIEEHEELKERYSFLVDQRQDLFHAEESLRKAIKKINETTRSLFMETFKKIQLEFDVFFKTLFGGGKALIELTDGKDVLESGIDIIAQPKGKKLQVISLLSGGEKTLTAVALLFAIFKVKPSPFCVLDEIDAPLDEANIDRFSRVLQEFIKTSQFIIITHNKKTISLADIIYGVTMEKSGISKMVSVKLVDKTKKEETITSN